MNIKDINKQYEDIKGFEYHNGIIIDKASKELIEAHIEVTDKSLNPWKTVHGGLIFGLADEILGLLCYMNGNKSVTIDANINYLKPCKGNIKGIGKIIKTGKTINVCKAEIYNEKNELAAIATMNYYNM